MADENEYDETETGNTVPNWRRKLEEDAKAGREASKALADVQTENQRLQQETAMRRAGIDYESPLAQMFVTANPELTDFDSIQTSWAQVQPGYTAPGQANQADMAALQQIGNAAGGGQASGAANPNFEAELDAIPMLINDKLNPNYVNEVLQKTAEQAAREGRTFSSNGSGTSKWLQGNASTPAATPLR